MYGAHEIIQGKDGTTKLVTSISMTGPLGFVWRKIVANDIVSKIPEQTDALIALARQEGNNG